MALLTRMTQSNVNSERVKTAKQSICQERLRVWCRRSQRQHGNELAALKWVKQQTTLEMRAFGCSRVG